MSLALGRRNGALDGRMKLVVAGFAGLFVLVAGKAAYLTLADGGKDTKPAVVRKEHIPRPDIVDRNGILLAGDMPFASVFAEPYRMIDVDEAVEGLLSVAPQLDAKKLRRQLANRKRKFVWIMRQVRPEMEEKILDLGIPGVRVMKEKRRVYPMGRMLAHVVGYSNIDSKGLTGIERFLDKAGALYTASLANPDGQGAAPAVLSIDVRVQHALRAELAKAMKKFKALGAGGLVMNIHTGEILALVSLPDFNPNSRDRSEALDKSRLNRMTSGVYELGSVIKSVTFAMALDEGTATLEKKYDARFPLRVGRNVIHDFHAQRRWLSVPEVFTHSSNIGTARMALEVGLKKHKAFLEKVGLFERLRTELPESARPLLPRHWSTIASVTASFGHGFAVQPLQGLAVIAGLINGGVMIPPTFLKRDMKTAHALGTRVISEATSRKMRYLFRLNAIKGTARRAAAPGWRVGGKTGTAEKVINGKYNKDHRLTTFIGAFPMDAPKYALLVMLDDPRPIPETHGYATSGWNAVPVAGLVVARIAPLLGIAPKLDTEEARAELARWRKLHGGQKSKTGAAMRPPQKQG